MSLESVVVGLHERFATVTQLRAIVVGEPKTIEVFPTLYTILDAGTFDQKGQVKSHTHRLMHRVVFEWDDGAATEPQLMEIYDALPAAVSADRRLGNRITNGIATIVEVEAGWDVIGGALYRVLDFYSESLDK